MKFKYFSKEILYENFNQKFNCFDLPQNCFSFTESLTFIIRALKTAYNCQKSSELESWETLRIDSCNKPNLAYIFYFWLPKNFILIWFSNVFRGYRDGLIWDKRKTFYQTSGNDIPKGIPSQPGWSYPSLG